MKKLYTRNFLCTTIALLFCCALCPANLLAQDWDNPYPENWKDDELEVYKNAESVITVVVNRTKHLTWYESGYIYAILDNNFNYAPDAPTETPWVADEEGTVEDYEGNVYRTLRFGDTWWMAENLRAKIILDSTCTDTTQMQLYVEWGGSCDGGYNAGNTAEFMYTHANDDAANDSVYGCLYNWNIGFSTLYKKTRLLKEEGWVIPDTLDFYNLIKRFGLWEYAEVLDVLQGYEYITTLTEVQSFGLFIKSDRNTLWATGSPLAGEIPYNASGLCFPPAGQMEGTHSGFGSLATIWTGTAVHETPNEGLGRRYYILGNTNNTMTSTTKGYGMARSVRLVKRIIRHEDPATISTNGNVTYTATDSIAWCPGYIDGIMKTEDTNTSTSVTQALSEQGIKIWGTQGNIMVQCQTEKAQAEIYNISGNLIKKVQLTSGTMQISIKQGMYIVRVNGVGKKVIVM